MLSDSVIFGKANSDLVDRAKASAVRLQGPDLDIIIQYIRFLYSIELADLANEEDEKRIRRSQGAAVALDKVSDFLSQTPTETRRATSRREV